MSPTYRIAEVAERSGFPATTLRYWEDIGLLPAAARTPAGYRVYDDASLERLAFVARAKRLGCTLDEIGDLLATWEGRRCAPVQDRLRDLVEAKLAATHGQVAELVGFAAQLQRTATHLAGPTPDGPCDDACGCGPLADAAPTNASRVGPGAATDPAAATVACTLSPGDVPERLDGWHAVLASVTGRDALPDGIRLTFAPDVEAAEVARLAAAEQGCCAFFRFALTVDARGTALEVRAPAEATDVVGALFGAAPA